MFRRKNKSKLLSSALIKFNKYKSDIYVIGFNIAYYKTGDNKQ